LFQAANPNCLLEDFVRWYSPRDWIETNDDITTTDDTPPDNVVNQSDVAPDNHNQPDVTIDNQPDVAPDNQQSEGWDDDWAMVEEVVNSPIAKVCIHQ